MSKEAILSDITKFFRMCPTIDQLGIKAKDFDQLKKIPSFKFFIDADGLECFQYNGKTIYRGR